MNAAIECIEDTLLIRRLQAREFSHDGATAERTAAINEDIASLERGLRLLTEADAGRQTPDAGPEKAVCGCAIKNSGAKS